jgi:hypothetical protein
LPDLGSGGSGNGGGAGNTSSGGMSSGGGARMDGGTAGSSNTGGASGTPGSGGTTSTTGATSNSGGRSSEGGSPGGRSSEGGSAGDDPTEGGSSGDTAGGTLGAGGGKMAGGSNQGGGGSSSMGGSNQGGSNQGGSNQGGSGKGGSSQGGSNQGGSGKGGSGQGGSSKGGSSQGGSGTGSGGKAGVGGAVSGGAPTGSGGAPDDSSTVATQLHGHTILMPCAMNTAARICTPKADTTLPCTNPAGGPAASYAGTHSHNEQITLGGTSGVRYIVRLRIQGEAEAKVYTGGTDANNSATLPANGLYTGGAANNSSNAYGAYFIRTDSPSQHYYLNSIGTASDSRMRHSTFPIDFEFDMEVEGGSTVCMVFADPNNSGIQNCAEPDNGTTCTGSNTVTVANLNPLTVADIGSQPYNGQFLGITVVSAMKKP